MSIGLDLQLVTARLGISLDMDRRGGFSLQDFGILSPEELCEIETCTIQNPLFQSLKHLRNLDIDWWNDNEVILYLDHEINHSSSHFPTKIDSNSELRPMSKSSKTYTTVRLIYFICYIVNKQHFCLMFLMVIEKEGKVIRSSRGL